MRMSNFLESVWFRGGEGKMMGGVWCFFPKLTKKFYPQNGEKTG